MNIPPAKADFQAEEAWGGVLPQKAQEQEVHSLPFLFQRDEGFLPPREQSPEAEPFFWQELL